MLNYRSLIEEAANLTGWGLRSTGCRRKIVPSLGYMPRGAVTCEQPGTEQAHTSAAWGATAGLCRMRVSEELQPPRLVTEILDERRLLAFRSLRSIHM